MTRTGAGPREEARGDDSHRLQGRRPARGHPLLPKVELGVWALARISLGWVFLWSFLDRFFALGFPTGRQAGGTVDVTAAWINGGSPTTEFLRSETNGRLGEALAGLAGQTWVDWLFMIGVAGIGLALLLGVGVRIAAAGGAVLLLMIWATTLQPADNPFMDHRLIYAILLTGLGMMNIGNVLGLGTIWSHTGLVHKYPFLR
ncbi:MAG TPA: hypothetical protein VJ398_03470 [Acidimicrobiia bacterium]|nr:hypothetical protein [Acidimicrobiia bacterium]